MMRMSSKLAAYEWDSMSESDLMRGISMSMKKECEAILDLEQWAAVSEKSFVGKAR